MRPTSLAELPKVPASTAPERFWKKVDKSGECWLWTGCFNNQGYGEFMVWPKKHYAHRFSWIMHFGEIPKDLQVLHRCDTPKCVRPDHLFVGTQKLNVADMLSKGRAKGAARGDLNPNRIISEKDVLFIRSSSLPNKQVGEMFGISGNYVWQIRTRKKWKYI